MIFSTGTGKSVTGVRLAYLFAKWNQGISGKSAEGGKSIPRQVLYCGPSNKSVDVVAGECIAIICSLL